MKRVLLLTALVSAGCSPGGAPPEGDSQSADTPEPSGPAKVVDAHMAAFNRRDVAAMSEHVSDDIVLLRLAKDEALVETRGRTALEEQMRSYFRSVGSVESVAEEIMVVGPFVAVRERVTWDSEEGPETARSLGVYEVRDGSIRRVWYFPAVE